MSRSLSLLFLVLFVRASLTAEDGPTRKVLMISVDGCRPDALLAANTPRIDELLAAGSWSLTAQTGDVPISGPSYSNMFTGVWRDKHGVHDNDFDGARFDEYPIFFCRLRAAMPDLVLDSIVRWAPLDPKLIRCADYHVASANDAAATDDAIRLLSEEDPDVLFLHLEDVDTAGHAHTFSPTAEGYLAAVERSDERVGRVLDALRARPTYGDEEWLVMVVCDHGGSGTDHHADIPENRTIFMILYYPGVKAGEILPAPYFVDVAPTAMGWMGLAIDPAWDLDGESLLGAVEPPTDLQLPADCTQDGQLDVSDPVCLLRRLFVGGTGPLPCGNGSMGEGNRTLLDSNGDAEVDVSDAVYVLLHLFAGGMAPAPGTECIEIPGCPSVCTS